MKNNRYKILILSDLKEQTENVLKSAVSLAKTIGGDISFFHVKKPTDIVENDNQLSAMRTINNEYNVTDKKIQNLLNPVSEEYGSDIRPAFTFGNVKEEINKYIEQQQPDIIVLGKRRKKSLSFAGDNVTQFILKKHKGVVMIVGNKGTLEPNKEISLGVLNDIEQSFNIDFVDDLISKSEAPLKSFKIVRNSDIPKATPVPIDKKTVEYVFEKTDNTMKNLSNYLLKNNVNLLCINRVKKNAENEENIANSDINDVISQLDISLLVSKE
ncbi:universal stress protein [Flavobacteriaceae bacterium AU392]|nr:universal stress protein [Flavobacteriaceae bacterium]RKM84706.1 universal stress protein [Flavobacteriaceae bacterium AU392]